MFFGRTLLSESTYICLGSVLITPTPQEGFIVEKASKLSWSHTLQDKIYRRFQNPWKTSSKIHEDRVSLVQVWGGVQFCKSFTRTSVPVVAHSRVKLGQSIDASFVRILGRTQGVLYHTVPLWRTMARGAQEGVIRVASTWAGKFVSWKFWRSICFPRLFVFWYNQIVSFI